MRFIVSLNIVVVTLLMLGQANAKFDVKFEEVAAKCKVVTEKEKAKADCRELIARLESMNTAVALAYIGLANMYLSDMANTMTEKEQLIINAKQYFNKARQQAPHNIDVLMAIGLYASPEEKQQLLAKAIELQPSHHLNYMLLAQLYLKKQQTKQQAITVLMNGYNRLKGENRWYIASRLYTTYQLLELHQEAEQFRARVFNDMGFTGLMAAKYSTLELVHLACSRFVFLMNGKEYCSDVMDKLSSRQSEMAKVTNDEATKIIAAISRLIRKNIQTSAVTETKKKTLLATLKALPSKFKTTAKFLLVKSLLFEGESKEKLLLQAIALSDDEQYKAMYWLAYYYEEIGQIANAKGFYKQLIVAQQEPWATRAATQLELIEN